MLFLVHIRWSWQLLQHLARVASLFVCRFVLSKVRRGGLLNSGSDIRSLR